jgi:cobalt-zinc-cadmium efflux system protein
VALIARRISVMPADARRTFGYRRAEIIGALINLTTLILIALYLVGESVMRFFEDHPIDGWIVVGVAGVALIVDAVTALLTWAASRDSLNIRAAFMHNVSDALASVGVIVAGTLILLFNWTWADLAATVLISVYILIQSIAMLKTTINILMQGVPEDLNVQRVIDSLRNLEGVEDIHHVHIWQLDEHTRSLEAHIVTAESDTPTRETIKGQIKAHLASAFDIGHSTLEFESAGSVPECCEHPTANECESPHAGQG